MSRLQLLFLFSLFPVVFVGTQAEERVFVVTSHESLSRVYVDGVEQYLPNANFRNATDNVTLPEHARLIAIQAVSTVDVCAGFIGSTTDDFFVTDSSWKCSEFGGEEWWGFGFDDTNWRNAFEVGRNGFIPNCPDLEYFPEISRNAYWIWTPDTLQAIKVPVDPLADRAVFCRGYPPMCEKESPCLNNGTCLSNDVAICACTDDYTGQFCESAITACVSQPCLNGGECNSTDDSSYVCNCRPGWTGHSCETEVGNRTLTITVKSTLYDLYIDGDSKQLIYGENWTVPDRITLSPNNRLIGLMAIDSSEFCAGVLGSVTGDFLVTDSNWTCTPFFEPQWFQLGHVESPDIWKPAYIVGPNHNVTFPPACEELTGISDISSNAFWIWTESIVDTPAFHQTIYCRGYLPTCERESPCLNGGTCNKNNETLCSCLLGFIGQYCQQVDLKYLTLTAKDTLYAAYVDGNEINLENGTNWEKTDSLAVFSISRLVAIMAIQLEGTCPGILVSVSDWNGTYIISDANWKCSACATVGWDNLGYDDSSWLPAHVGKKNEYANDSECEVFGEIPTISSDAYWIWTDTSTKQDVTVYCRGYLPICDVHPCTNGGTCNRNLPALCTCTAGYTGVYCENLILPDVTEVYSWKQDPPNADLPKKMETAERRIPRKTFRKDKKAINS